MKKFYFGSLAAAIVVAAILFNLSSDQLHKADKTKRSGHKASPVEMKQARHEYFNKLLRDPVTKQIPKNVHIRDLEFAKAYKAKTPQGLFKGASAGGFNYAEAGPHDVGGRTRALAYDIQGRYILSGGVSGGVWKSSDEGNTWSNKSTKEDILAVNSFAQDPRTGKDNIWYYVCGEYNGNSTSDPGAFFTGGGFYKSTDHGETWTEILKDNDFASWNNYFDYCGRVVVDNNGHIFVASHAYGIIKSTDGGSTFDKVLGGGSFVYSDIEVDAAGNLIAYLSPYDWGRGDQEIAAGIHYSTDGGANWTPITLPNFETTATRGIVRIADSNTDVAYLFYYDGSENYGFYKINIAAKTAEKRSENLPNYAVVDLGSQSNYNMVFEIYPGDENLVIVGGTSLFKSFDGFATKPSELFLSKTHIGGYQRGSTTTSSSSYANHHPDQHSMIFDPKDPKKVFSGHDGGLSFTEDITLNSISEAQTWVSKNNGYNVTQFYTFAISPFADDDRMVGGTQDNGSPYFSVDVDTSYDISSGDGAFCYFGKEDIYVSSQYGRTYRLGLAQNGGNPPNIFKASGFDWDVITPITGFARTDEMHFINPFTADINDLNYVYFTSRHQLWRNDNVKAIAGEEGTSSNGYSTGDTDDYWTKMAQLTSGNDEYTAVSVSYRNDKYVLYVAVCGDGVPKILRYDNAKTATTADVETAITGADAGTYVKEIAVNPQNSSEIIVIMTNYNTKSVWYSNDAAESFSYIGGDLGDVDGPSIRAAEIVSTDNGTIYMLGTSTGMYVTSNLAGENTVWSPDARNVIGNVVVSWITQRYADNKIAVATHGRGAFLGTYDPNKVVGIEDNEVPAGFELSQNYPNPFNPATTINYSVGEASDVSINIYNVNGQIVKQLVNTAQEAGTYKVVWDATNNNGNKVASGIYFYQIKAGEFVQTKKMNLLK